MRTWNLTPDDPIFLTLASDARIKPPDYLNDHIWELNFKDHEPLALVIQTNYGLRARSFRIFPRFIEGDKIVSNPEEFTQSIAIHSFYPNFVELGFQPLSGIDVSAEYWVPDSHVLACRFTLTNQSEIPRLIRLQLIGQLIPTEGQRLAPIEIQAAWVLAGQTANLFPVLFITGGPTTNIGSYPSLNHTLELEAGQSQQYILVSAACDTLEESFNLARQTAARPWEAEKSFLDMLNAGQVEIYTGNLEWDIVFMQSQRLANCLLMGPTSALPHPSFLITRQPGQGYSLRGDGNDYDHLWNGQPPLEALYLSQILLPSQAKIVQGFIRNYLSIQTDLGVVDWKPGLAGQRSFILATPVLATLSWQVYELTEDLAFLREVHPGLLNFLRHWFHPSHDRDGDGIPEWDHLMQTGAEDSIRYAAWHEWSAGADIQTAETPCLAAFLYRECLSLMEMTRLVTPADQQEAILAELSDRAEKLRLAVEISWDSERSCYRDIDRDSHFSTPGEKLAEHRGLGEIRIQRTFEYPVRLLIYLRSESMPASQPDLVIHGVGASGQPRVERVMKERFKRSINRSIFTGDRVYQSIDFIAVNGIDPQDTLEIYCVAYDAIDQTSLVPLWAGIPDSDRAALMIEKVIANPAVFWRSNGLPACPDPPLSQEAQVCQSVNLIYNSLIGAGLIQYGYRERAAELLQRLMKTIITNLKEEHAFRRYYHAESGRGLGDRNALQGLAPIGLFMEVLGLKIHSPYQIFLEGFNPFPWPVTVKYKGLTVLRLADKTNITFPDGQSVIVSDPSPQDITLQSKKTQDQ